MNKIISVDPARYTITAEAGCILQSIHDAAAQVDRAFAMDWGARGSATMGGGISTNAGGINVLRFGNTRDQVLGLEVVLPDGRIWDGLRALRKDSSGYDLKHLFIGAEGTLGIVTKAVLKLHPRPAHEQSMWASVADLGRLMELFALARSVASEGLTAFELVPGYTYEKALAQYPVLARPVETRADWYVIVRFSGQQPVADKFEDFFSRAFEAGLVTDGALAQSIAQENNIWNLRDEIPPLKLLKGKMLKWDASVPIDRIVPFLAEAQRRAHAIRERPARDRLRPCGRRQSAHVDLPGGRFAGRRGVRRPVQAHRQRDRRSSSGARTARSAPSTGWASRISTACRGRNPRSSSR